MGLDMSLYEKKKNDNSSTALKEIAYWRKANWIHKYFVDKVQNGEDDCKKYQVFKEDLQDLCDIIKKIQRNKDLAKELLPTQPGFFFGSTEYDDWYYDCLDETKEKLEDIINNFDFENNEIYYWSSW